VILGADPVFAYIRVFAPAATGHLDFFTNGPTDGAGLQQVGDDVSGVTPPGFHDLLLFANLLELVVA
jgi:hypothetical protein